MIQCSCEKKYRLGVAAHSKSNTLECLMIFVRPVIYEPDMDHDLYRYFATPRRFRSTRSLVPSKRIVKKRNMKKENNIIKPIASTSNADFLQSPVIGPQVETFPSYEFERIDTNNNSDQYVDLNQQILIQISTQPMDSSSEPNSSRANDDTSIENPTTSSSNEYFPIQFPVHNETDVPNLPIAANAGNSKHFYS